MKEVANMRILTWKIKNNGLGRERNDASVQKKGGGRGGEVWDEGTERTGGI